MSIKNELKEVYNTISQEFSSSRVFPWEELQLFIPYLKDNFKILDLGCGNGRLIKILEENNCKIEYTGIDFSTELIKQAQESFPKYTFKVKDMNNIDYEENSFNMVFMIASFHHLETKEERLELLKKINKWLKPGGYLFMTNWHLFQKKYFKFLFKNIRKKKAWNDFFIPWQTYSQKGERLWRFYHSFTKRELENLLKKTNFKLKPHGVYKTEFNINSFVQK